jgi:Carboxypeptidase regulatory-like domain
MKRKRKSEDFKTQRAVWNFFYGRVPLTAAALVCVLAVALPAFAGKKKPKPPRVVMGIVVDGSENPIIGAVVEMTDVQTGKKSAMYTQEGGHYEFSGLNEDHDYKIQASFRGVESQTRTASSFDTRNTIRLNLQIPPPKEEEGAAQ